MCFDLLDLIVFVFLYSVAHWDDFNPNIVNKLPVEYTLSVNNEIPPK